MRRALQRDARCRNRRATCRPGGGVGGLPVARRPFQPCCDPHFAAVQARPAPARGTAVHLATKGKAPCSPLTHGSTQAARRPPPDPSTRTRRSGWTSPADRPIRHPAARPSRAPDSPRCPAPYRPARHRSRRRRRRRPRRRPPRGQRHRTRRTRLRRTLDRLRRPRPRLRPGLHRLRRRLPRRRGPDRRRTARWPLRQPRRPRTPRRGRTGHVVAVCVLGVAMAVVGRGVGRGGSGGDAGRPGRHPLPRPADPTPRHPWRPHPRVPRHREEDRVTQRTPRSAHIPKFRNPTCSRPVCRPRSRGTKDATGCPGQAMMARNGTRNHRLIDF